MLQSPVKKIVVAAVYGLFLMACNDQNDKTPAAGSFNDSLVKAVTGTTPPAKPNPDTIGLHAANRYLQEGMKADLEKNLIDSSSRKFLLANTDLNNDGRNEIFVFLTGPWFCGSGGCTAVLLTGEGTLITKFTVMDLPLLLSKKTTNGWKDIICYSNGKNRLLKFDGKKYPSNASTAPEAKDTGSTSSLLTMQEDQTWHRF